MITSGIFFFFINAPPLADLSVVGKYNSLISFDTIPTLSSSVLNLGLPALLNNPVSIPNPFLSLETASNTSSTIFLFSGLSIKELKSGLSTPSNLSYISLT